MNDSYRPAVHIVGMRRNEEAAATRQFGPPDFVHMHMDYRAMADIAPGDTVVSGSKYDFCPHAFDDSNEPDDPAARERN